MVIDHDIFAEKVKEALVRAGLPIASTYDSALSCGVYLEIADEERMPPELFLKWRVHPQLNEHFMRVPADLLESDPQVKELQNAWQAMNTAITAILEFAGFSVRVLEGERAWELLVRESRLE
jgi:hypothetical protein